MRLNMIKYKDKTLEDYSIDPETAIITNDKGEVQETSIHKDGRPYFKGMAVNVIQVHTHLGYKPGYDVHHLDHNPMNNSLSNLVYLTRNEHMEIHSKERKGEKNSMYGRHHSEETRKKMSDTKKGKNHPLYGKHRSEETRKKMSDSLKGRHHSSETRKKMSDSHKNMSEETRKKMSEAHKGKMWITNGIKQRRIHFDEKIPEGFVRGRLNETNKNKTNY